MEKNRDEFLSEQSWALLPVATRRWFLRPVNELVRGDSGNGAFGSRNDRLLEAGAGHITDGIHCIHLCGCDPKEVLVGAADYVL